MKKIFPFFTLFSVVVFVSSPTRAQDAPMSSPPQVYQDNQSVPPPPDQGGQDQDDQGISFQTFYDQLGDQGSWIQTDDYGYVFQPNVTDPNWAPYTAGHWVYTDQGWTWASDEPWGWATYHYGRWANVDDLGWVWVPGYRWAPAWVSWRYGGGYAGWAPLPPETLVGSEYGDPGSEGPDDIHYGGDVDVNFHIGAGWYNFVPVEDLGAPNCGAVIVNRYGNYGIINHTTNVTNININHARGGFAGNGSSNGFNGVSAGGPPINQINARAHQRIPTVQLTAAARPGVSTLQGNSLAVFAPRVNPSSAQQAKPTVVGQTLSHPTFNRGDSISRPMGVTASVRPAAPSVDAIAAAQKAQSSAPAKAKIVTARTPVKSTRSLTSLVPVASRTAKPSSTSPSSTNPTPVHHTANAPYTGESPQVYHPQTQAISQPQREITPTQSYHPQTEVAPQPQREAAPEENYHPQETQPQFVKPVQVYHTQDQNEPQYVKPAQTYHTQEEPQFTKPVQSFHPQTEAAPEEHHASAPAEPSHPSAPPAQAFHPSAAPAQTHASAPSAPASHPAPAGGGKPSPAKGDGKPDDKKPGQ